MIEDQMKAWVAALRSGEYLQTSGHLHTAVGYCCLGVLCSLSQRYIWHKVPEIDRVGCLEVYQYATKTGELPPDVAAMYGLTSTDPSLIFSNQEELHEALSTIGYDTSTLSGSNIRLSTLNDSGISFGSLAKLIERYWKNIA